MSIQAMARVMESSQAEGTARLVLLVMANRAGGDEDVCFASVERLARDARVHTRTVQRWIRHLEEIGEVAHLGHHPRFATNLYAVMPKDGGGNLPVPQMGDGISGPQLPPELDELGSTVSTSLSPTAEVQSGARSRDELWEVLFLAQTGEQYNPSARISGRERSKVNAAAKDLRSAGFTAEDAKMGIHGWPVAMGDARITALGLSANLSRCLNAAAGSEFRQREQRETVEDRALKLVREHMAEESRLEIGEVLA